MDPRNEHIRADGILLDLFHEFPYIKKYISHLRAHLT